MLAKLYEKKFKLIIKSTSNFEQSELTIRIEKILSSQEWCDHDSLGLQRALHLDLGYLYCRHRPWTSSTLFYDIVSEFLHCEYKLPRKLCDQLSQTINLQSSSIKNPDHDPHFDESTDYNFLRYIFVACATATDDHSLQADLGLGDSIIKRIKKSAQTVMNHTAPSDTVQFEPQIDHQLQQIILAITEEIKAIPWAMDLYHLDYMIRSKTTEAPAALSTDQIFQILLNIGRLRKVSHETLNEWIHKINKKDLLHSNIETSDTKNDHLCINEKILFLQKMDLIFSDEVEVSLEKRTFMLTMPAYKFTADAFACKFLRTRTIDLSHFSEMSSYYQIALIRRLPDHFKQNLLGYAKTNILKLAPTTLEYLIKNFSRSINHNTLSSSFLPFIADKNDYPWLKSALLRSFGFLHKADNIDPVLRSIVIDHKSDKIKDAALHAISLLNRKRPENARIQL